MDFNKSNKAGISLITLIITIVVIVILTGAIVLLIANNNPITKAMEAKAASDRSAVQDAILLYQTKDQSLSLPTTPLALSSMSITLKNLISVDLGTTSLATRSFSKVDMNAIGVKTSSTDDYYVRDDATGKIYSNKDPYGYNASSNTIKTVGSTINSAATLKRVTAEGEYIVNYWDYGSGKRYVITQKDVYDSNGNYLYTDTWSMYNIDASGNWNKINLGNSSTYGYDTWEFYYNDLTGDHFFCDAGTGEIYKINGSTGTRIATVESYASYWGTRTSNGTVFLYMGYNFYKLNGSQIQQIDTNGEYIDNWQLDNNGNGYFWYGGGRR